jgi:hypothetical protein
MSFDPSKYASKVLNTEATRVDRDYVDLGESVIKITSMNGHTSQSGSDLVILEGEILAHQGGSHRVGQLVKHILALSGVPSWRVDRSLAALKAIVGACIPAGVEVTSDMISNVITGGEQSALAGASIKIVGKQKQSKAGKEFTDFSYMRAAQVGVSTEYTAQWNNAPASDTSDNEGGDLPF